jgi:hypothetical protein
MIHERYEGDNKYNRLNEDDIVNSSHELSGSKLGSKCQIHELF